jgi:hypothetical protein
MHDINFRTLPKTDDIAELILGRPQLQEKAHDAMQAWDQREAVSCNQASSSQRHLLTIARYCHDAEAFMLPVRTCGVMCICCYTGAAAAAAAAAVLSMWVSRLQRTPAHLNVRQLSKSTSCTYQCTSLRA